MALPRPAPHVVTSRARAVEGTHMAPWGKKNPAPKGKGTGKDQHGNPIVSKPREPVHEMHLAARNGDLPEMKRLLAEGVVPATRYFRHITSIACTDRSLNGCFAPKRAASPHACGGLMIMAPPGTYAVHCRWAIQ